MLNVSPYMYDTINKETNDDQTNKKPKNEINNQKEKEIEYELVGIVVHSGQANAGHYYSFIKGPKNNTLNIDQEIYELEQLNQSIDENYETNANESNLTQIKSQFANNKEENEKWYKYNDTSVEEIFFNDQTLVEECFGGTFTATGDYNKMLPEERVRFWNGYMLFYKEPGQNLNRQRKTASDINKLRQSKDVLSSQAYKITKDSFSELAELVTKGDEKGLFCTGLPPAIEQIVKSENLEFCKNRAIYDLDYFKFIFNMVRIFRTNSLCGDNKIIENDLFTSECCNLGLEFLYNTYFKTGKKLRGDLSQWIDMFKDLLLNSKEGGNTMLSFIVKHEQNSSFIRHYLLECPIVEIRETCGTLFENCLSSLVTKFDIQPLNNSKITSLITSLIQLLDKAVVDLCKNAQEYFKFLYAYANMVI
jgi:ubiquitin carboxyl-terminal hydrolase 9/24